MTGFDPIPAAPRPGVLDRGFDAAGLCSMRGALTSHARSMGLPGGEATEHLLIAAGELAANAISHGGGTGRLRAWRQGDRVYCEVSDHGPGFADPRGAGTAPPAQDLVSGRGLWMVRQLCDQLVIANEPAGARVTAMVFVPRVAAGADRGGSGTVRGSPASARDHHDHRDQHGTHDHRDHHGTRGSRGDQAGTGQSGAGQRMRPGRDGQRLAG